MQDFLLAVLGLGMLVLAGDALVRGAVNLSLRIGIPALIVSLTIVAVGTSAPELLVGVSAVLDGAPGIALGNVVGSNTANVLLVLGLPALLAGLPTAVTDTRSSYVQMLMGTILFMALAAVGQIGLLSGLVLLLVFVAFMVYAVICARRHRAEARALEAELAGTVVEEADPNMPGWRIAGLLALGLIGLPLGANLLVDAATAIARRYEVSETVIGLTLVALGTSLPELATTVAAAFRRQADVALGNVIGSNVANLLGIIGVSAMFGTIPVPQDILRFDILIMALASLAIAPFVFLPINMTRLWGLLFTGGYVLYVVRVLI